MSRGKFIVFEGIDGSGKSTQAKMLHEHWITQGIPSHLTCEPTKNTIGKIIRQIFSGELKMDNLVVAGLFVADRLDHLTNPDYGIIKILDQGINVITDRYYLSSYAYQGVFAPMEWIIQANAQARELLKPDITFYLDLEPDDSMNRINTNRSTKEIYENLEIQKKVAENYRKAIEIVKEVELLVVINAKLDANHISKTVIHSI